MKEKDLIISKWIIGLVICSAGFLILGVDHPKLYFPISILLIGIVCMLEADMIRVFVRKKVRK